MTRRAGLALILALLLARGARPAAASDLDEGALADQVRAGFLYNFLKFAEWPEESFAAEPREITIAVLGDDRLALTASAALAGKSAHGTPLRVRRISGAGELGALLPRVHLLFLGAEAGAEAADALALARDRPVLTVGLGPGFCRAGGVIALVEEEGRLRFEVNQDASRRAGLRLSSKLLGLARAVHPGGRP